MFKENEDQHVTVLESSKKEEMGMISMKHYQHSHNVNNEYS